MKKAIDVSSWQGVINMKAVRNSGIECVILRAGWGKNNTDPKFGDNAVAMNNLSVPGGIYWFSYALSTVDASNEGAYAVAHAKKYWDKCIVAYDFEYDSVNYARKNNVTNLSELAFLIVCSTFITYFLIPLGQKRIRPTLVSMYSYIQPIIAILISIYVGMDSLSWQKVLAATMVFGGVVLVNYSRSAK